MHCNAWQSNALKHNTAHCNELVLHCTAFQSKAMQGSAVERARCDASPPCQSPVLIRLKQLCSRKTLPRVNVHPKSSPCVVKSVHTSQNSSTIFTCVSVCDQATKRDISISLTALVVIALVLIAPVLTALMLIVLALVALVLTDDSSNAASTSACIVLCVASPKLAPDEEKK